jgi:hypothetical protein
MLAMWLEVLVIVTAIWVIVSMLLWSELMHLLGTGPKLIWPTVTAHRHCIIVSKGEHKGKDETNFVRVVVERKWVQHIEVLGSYQD